MFIVDIRFNRTRSMFVHWIEWMSEAGRLVAVGEPFESTAEPMDSPVVAKHSTFLKGNSPTEIKEEFTQLFDYVRPIENECGGSIALG